MEEFKGGNDIDNITFDNKKVIKMIKAYIEDDLLNFEKSHIPVKNRHILDEVSKFIILKPKP